LRSEEGANLVEFAFSLGIFLAVTIGIIMLCMALFTYEYVDFAAREATRWAIVRGNQCSISSSSMKYCDATSTDIQTYVQGLNYPLINTNKIQATAQWLQVSYSKTSPPVASWTLCSDQCNSPGNEVQVLVSYPYTMTIPFAGSYSFTISSSSTMVISQ
jgi:Flp pilus assembly protein TadG